MPTKYRFTSDVPLIMVGLSHGPGVIVAHLGGPGAPEREIAPDGATVTLYPGDEITIPGTYEHAYLEPFATGGTVAKKLTVDEIKAALTARGVDFDQKARKAALETLLAAQPDVPTIVSNIQIDPADLDFGESAEGDIKDLDASQEADSGDAADTSSTTIETQE